MEPQAGLCDCFFGKRTTAGCLRYLALPVAVAAPTTQRYGHLRTSRSVGWNRLSLRRQGASLRFLACVPNGPPMPLLDYVRKNRSGVLQPLLGQTEHRKSMLLPRATKLWRSLPSEVTQGPFEEKEYIKEFWKCATLHLK